MVYKLINDDCLTWFDSREENSITAVITDPPFGLKEFDPDQLEKKDNNDGGIWRIPPTLNGVTRSPLPRFTALNGKERETIYDFFLHWGTKVERVLVPGGHVIIASTPILSHILHYALYSAGFEKRGEIVRVVKTLRGGDRPKGAEKEFSFVSSMPRGCWESWAVFRKAFTGTLAENLRKWKAGGIRRINDDRPFQDVIEVGVTPKLEREIAPHPSLKPQKLMRILVWISLPLGEGVILDPFAGAGSTIGAAEALGIDSYGIEINKEYFDTAEKAVPALAKIKIRLPFEEAEAPTLFAR